MFGLSFGEVIIIILVVIVFVRPKDFPRLFSKLGKLYGRISRQVGTAKRLMSELEEEVQRTDEGEAPGDNKEEER